MDWDEWTGYLEELVGHGSSGQSVHLLAPGHGRDDLTPQEADDLANAVHQRLFIGRSPAAVLINLGTRHAQESLPLLYLSSWLARQQENRLAFWQPYFNDAVVRGRLSPQTVQQSLAPLITDLWWKMHREWNIYRPQEGRVHVKWPQAHAGLARSEVDLLLALIAKSVGWSEEPPDVLYVEPEEFLGLLRIWLQFESYAHRQLQHLIYGPDGLALVVAELAQRILADRWPPIQRVYERAPGPQARPPYLVLSYDPLALHIVLPEGSIPTYTLVYASCADDLVQLETSYSSQVQRTRYASYKWPVGQIPWPRIVTLSYEDQKLDLGIRPECLFAKHQGATLMFESATGRYARRWRPRDQFLLLLLQGELPYWISELFVGEEVVDVGSIAGYDFQVISAIGRDITKTLERNEASVLLRRLEVEIARTGAMITLPDVDDLYRTTISLRGGILTNDGSFPTYLVDASPSILAQEIQSIGTTVSVLRRNTDGSETSVASAYLSTESSDRRALLQLPALDEGSYVVRGVQQPIYFNLVSAPITQPLTDMQISLRLLRGEGIAAGDDIRHFMEKGLEIAGWPHAPATLMVQTEAGSSLYPLRLDDEGKRTVRAYEIQLPTTTRWARIQATCWLARSEIIDLALRPYVAPADWILDEARFWAIVTGAIPGTNCRVTLIPRRPWESSIFEVHTVVEEDSSVKCEMPGAVRDAWILLCDPISNLVWLVTSINGRAEEYSIADCLYVCTTDFSLPNYVSEAGELDLGLRSMVSLVHVACLVSKAMIPSLTDVIPQTLADLSTSLDLSRTILVELPDDWGGHIAKITVSDRDWRNGILEVGSHQLKVQIVTVGAERWILWDEPSAPRVCGACRMLMTERQWYAHECGGVDGRPFLVPGRSFQLTAYVAWPVVMDAVERLLLNALASGAEVPKGLESVWAALQQSHRDQTDNPIESPEVWIKGSADGWRLLFDLLNNKNKRQAVYWPLISEKLKPFEQGIVALAKMFT